MFTVHSRPMFFLFLPVVVLFLQIFPCLAHEGTPPRRITINGSVLSEPESPSVPLKLRGFNFWVDLDQPLEAMDTAVTRLLPGTNLARLVMVHWQGKYSKRRSSNVAVIIGRIVFTATFVKTNPNKITNCF